MTGTLLFVIIAFGGVLDKLSNNMTSDFGYLISVLRKFDWACLLFAIVVTWIVIMDLFHSTRRCKGETMDASIAGFDSKIKVPFKGMLIGKHVWFFCFIFPLVVTVSSSDYIEDCRWTSQGWRGRRAA
ncbi:hypothetical protein L1987_55013 [Smallanthus sonchifolius]|uniref:Uncharacterized protein n=1 Tax=Smallanthus sonchifolius TaxID=185202 RepID=A0ACB9E9S0_9ASTR|nr:hypothetical protein L1987_55013 [Smallanthus sonchifolius]